MQYTAIIKNGGLFIPNIFAEVSDDNGLSQSQVVQVELDIAFLYTQMKDKQMQMDYPKSLSSLNKADNKVQKVNLGDLPIQAFDTITDPVAWQNTLREAW